MDAIMNYLYMTEKHNPPVSYGDCLRACIASVLEVEKITDVPHFTGDGCEDIDQLRARVMSFCLTRSVAPFTMAYSGELALGDLLGTMADNNPNINFILFGATFDGVPHAVVCRNGVIIHDPSPWQSGIEQPSPSGYWGIMIFVSSVLLNE